MNPWGVALVLLGLMLIVIGFHGTQHNIVSALKGAKP